MHYDNNWFKQLWDDRIEEMSLDTNIITIGDSACMNMDMYIAQATMTHTPHIHYVDVTPKWSELTPSFIKTDCFSIIDNNYNKIILSNIPNTLSIEFEQLVKNTDATKHVNFEPEQNFKIIRK